MELPIKEAEDIVRQYNDEWELIEKVKTSKSSVCYYYQGVFKYIPTGKFYKFEWVEQHSGFDTIDIFDYSDHNPTEVFPKIVYLPIMPKLSTNEARMIIASDHDDWETIRIDMSYEQSSNTMNHVGIFRNLSTKRLCRMRWSIKTGRLDNDRAFIDEEPYLVEIDESEIPIF